MKLERILAVVLLLASSVHARAEVRQSTPDGFFVAISTPIAASPTKTYAALTAVAAWWSDAHTWSGSAANLSLKAEAGGCFCERWKDGSAEQGRVILALPGRLLRLQTALGPLQELALSGVLSVWVRSEDDGSTRLDVEYRVNGTAESGLDVTAPAVDDMLGTQVARLKRYVETGSADVPASPAKQASPQGDAARAAILEQWKQAAEAERAKTKAPASKSAPAKKSGSAGGP
ncbi:MAG TPA: hypothetical protein VGC30_11675 [Dokdonella sp.]